MTKKKKFPVNSREVVPVDEIAKAFQRVLNSNNQDVQMVMKYLSFFCGEYQSLIFPEEHTTYALLGRREVLLEINKLLSMDISLAKAKRLELEEQSKQNETLNKRK